MKKFLLYIFLLTPLLLLEHLFGEFILVEEPFERHELSRRDRHLNRDQMKVKVALEGVLVTDGEALSAVVEEPLRREQVATVYSPEGREAESRFEGLIERLRSFFRREWFEVKSKPSLGSGPQRLRPLKEPSRIGFQSRFSRLERAEAKSPSGPSVQVLGLPRGVEGWVGPIPTGGRDWEKVIQVSDDETALRVRAWSRLDGEFRPFVLRVTDPFALGEENHDASIPEWAEASVIVTKPRHTVIKVEVWAGEAFLVKSGYVALERSHQDLVVEVLPWTLNSAWKPVALDVKQLSGWGRGLALKGWRRMQLVSGYSLVGLSGPFRSRFAAEVPTMEMGFGDLMSWCLSSPRERAMAPWQSFGEGAPSPQLRVLGALEELRGELKGPLDWINLSLEARRKGGLVVLGAPSRSIQMGNVHYYPLSLLLFEGGGVDGVMWKDPEDWSLYGRLLERGYRMTLFQDRGLSWKGWPVGGDHLVRSDEGMRSHIEALRRGLVVAGRGGRLTFELYESLGGAVIGEIGDRLEIDSSQRWLPKLTFEVDDQSDGVVQVELWSGSRQLQKTSLHSALKRGEALFAFESFEPGQTVRAGIRLSDGRFLWTNPIFLEKKGGTDEAGLHAVELELPEGVSKGYALLKGPGLFQEIELSANVLISMDLPLRAEVECWTEEGQRLKASVFSSFWEKWKSDGHGALCSDPLEQLESMNAVFPLKLDWMEQ